MRIRYLSLSSICLIRYNETTMNHDYSTNYAKLMLLMISMRRTLCHCSDALDLTSAQSILLLILEPKNGKSMNQLSDQMGCDASNMTGLVDRLESRNFIERTPDPKDKRVKLISLTKSGIKQRNELMSEVSQNTSLDLDKLTNSEKIAFEKILNKLTS